MKNPLSFTVKKGEKFYRDWENSTETMACVGESESRYINWLYPVKIFDSPKSSAFLFHAEKIVVRTDAYPLLWIWFYLAIHIEAKFQYFFYFFMGICNLVGLAKTPKYCTPSLSDFLWYRQKK